MAGGSTGSARTAAAQVLPKLKNSHGIPRISGVEVDEFLSGVKAA